MVIERECRTVRRVLVMYGSADRESVEDLIARLAPLGIDARLVSTPGEALWALEDSARPSCAVIVDGDRAVPDHLGLLAFLREHHPLVHRVIVMTQPAAAQIDDHVVVARDALDSLDALLDTRPA